MFNKSVRSPLCAGAARKRAALNHSRVMIHQTSGGVQGQASDIEITARKTLKVQRELYEIMAKHTGQPYQPIHDSFDRDYWMTSREARDFGMDR